MKTKILPFVKKNAMVIVSAAAAIVSLFITPPGKDTLRFIDFKTLATLFMLLTVLDGFKSEDLFRPVINRAQKIKSQVGISFFLIFAVFFSSMLVTNDVSLIIFVPLTIILFRAGNKEKYIVPVLVLENIAAVRGSLLTPFGSPQNLFLYSQSGLSTAEFLKMMLPLWIGSILLLAIFIFAVYIKNPREVISFTRQETETHTENKVKKAVYLILFAVIVATIVTRTTLWPFVTLLVIVTLLIADRKVFLRIDYGLIFTFFCFFVFSSSISLNPSIAEFLKRSVAGNEYLWSILLSQVISNVPASIVLWPFSKNLPALIYGLDSAGLVTIIGSLASVINIRIYTREYPDGGKRFLLAFEAISLAFFAIIFFPQMMIL